MSKLNDRLTLVANVGVVAGLIFVAIQVRQGNQMAELQREANSNARMYALMDMVIADPELIALMARDPADLAELEASRLELVGIRILTGFEDIYFDMQSGLVDEAGQVRIQRSVYHRPILNYGMPFAWESFKSRADPAFIAWFERNIVAP